MRERKGNSERERGRRTGRGEGGELEREGSREKLERGGELERGVREGS